MISYTRAIIYTIIFTVLIFLFSQFFMVAVSWLSEKIIPFIFSFENKYLTVFFLVIGISLYGIVGAFAKIAETGISPAKALRKYYFWDKRQKEEDKKNGPDKGLLDKEKTDA